MSSNRKKGKGKSRRGDLSEDNLSDISDSVANVNMEDGDLETRNASRKRHGSEKNSDSSNPKKGKKVAKESKKKKSDAVHKENFEEDNQLARIHVRRNEDSFCGGPSEDSDDEVILNKLIRSTNNNATRNVTQPEDGEILDAEESVQLSTSFDKEVSQSSRPSQVNNARMMNPTEREEVIGETLNRVQEMFDKSGFLEATNLIKKHFENANKEKRDDTRKDDEAQKKDKRDNNKKNPSKLSSKSEVTIYDNALRDETSKRFSSSSEEEVDMGNGKMEMLQEREESPHAENLIDKLISENRPPPGDFRGNGQRFVEDEQRPSTSAGHASSTAGRNRQEDRADLIIKEAEKAKAKIFSAPGKNNVEFDLSRDFVHSMMVDDQYMVVAAHVDEQTRGKISKGEYIDFAKLIPRDRAMAQGDQRMQMVFRNGMAYWAPVQDAQPISSFMKWEQAFRVFSDIYCRSNPTRSPELIQYSHIISTLSTQYVWDNVYAYNIDFRLHMQQHPTRNWSMILSQAWFLRLREKLTRYEHGHGGHGHGPGKFAGRNSNNNGRSPPSGGDECRRFNRGRCTYGHTCRYEHKCSYCFKFGHGYFQCRKAERDRNNNKGGSTGQQQPSAPVPAPQQSPSQTVQNNKSN